jgi:hypothetical protein
MEVLEQKRVGRKPSIHVDILAELAKVREEKLDGLMSKADSEIEDRTIASLLGRTTTSIKTQVNELLARIGKGNVFTLDEIKIVANRFALKFLDAKHFKGDYPSEALTALRVKVANGAAGQAVKILAPAGAFEINYYNDPVMFIQEAWGSNNWVVVHKWGNDFTVWRRLLSRQFKALQSLAMFSITALLITLFILVIQNFTWYYAIPTDVVLGIATVITLIGGFIALCDNPEPWFYDNAQWDRSDVSTNGNRN